MGTSSMPQPVWHHQHLGVFSVLSHTYLSASPRSIGHCFNSWARLGTARCSLPYPNLVELSSCVSKSKQFPPPTTPFALSLCQRQ